MANPGLNALIIGVGVIGIVLSFRQVLRLYPEIAWVNNFRLADPGLAVDDRRSFLRRWLRSWVVASDAWPCRRNDARILELDRHPSRRSPRYFPLYDRAACLPRSSRNVLGPDRNRQLGRRRHSGPQGERRRRFHVDSLRDGLAAPLSGMGISFSSSLFGLAGSLVLGFLDLQSSQAQNRFYTELEDWLSTTVYDQAAEPAVPTGVTGEVRSAIERLRGAVDQSRPASPLRLPWPISPGNSRSCAPYAHRTADDPRLG